MNWRERVVSDPAIHHGDACIKGTRVPVRVIVCSLAQGDTFAQLLAVYPQLTMEDLSAAVEFSRAKS